MRLGITLRPRAEADLEDAFRWYEERLPGLGEAFLQAVDACFARVERHPEAFPEVHPRVRRAPLHRFPYGAFYVASRPEAIDIIGCMHHDSHYACN